MEASFQVPQLPAIDVDGLLIYPEDWSKPIAANLARKLEINELTDEHWLVIDALRDYYTEFGVSPPIHSVCHMHGKDELWVHNLFYTSLNAWRIAGLPDPGEEAKSYLNDM